MPTRHTDVNSAARTSRQAFADLAEWVPFGTDYVPSPYVDWVSLAAARPVVIPWDAPRSELTESPVSGGNGLGGERRLADDRNHGRRRHCHET